MANYTKSFNFRNGVQVDDSNFIVNSVGLVGIGTTIPEKRLDVRGNASITGITSLSGAVVSGVITAGNIKVDSVSGIVTATKFVGDASGLTNIVAIATEGFIANAGGLSTTTNIGIGSEIPTTQLDVLGDSIFTGITSFIGLTTTTDLIAHKLDVIGVSTFGNAVDINSSVDVSGLTTFGSAVDINANLDVDGITELDTTNISETLNVTGLSTFGSAVDINANLDVDGRTELDITNISETLNVTGISTFQDDIFVGIGATVGIGSTVFFGDDVKLKFGDTDGLEIYHSENLEGTNDSYIDSSARNLYIRLNTETDNGGNIALQAKKDEHGILIEDDGTVKLYFNNNLKFETIGTGASVYNQLNVASLNGGASGLSSHFGSLRYGNENALNPYSTRRSLDLINTDSGNINYYINANNLSNTGNFHWHKGFNNVQLMTLTGIGGSLGIGVTDPILSLHVGGGSTVTGDSFFGRDVEIERDLSVLRNVDVTGILTAPSITGDVTGNITATSGTSNFNQLLIGSGIATISNLRVNKLGINKSPAGSNNFLTIQVVPNNEILINDSGQIGIRTTSSGISTDVVIQADQASAVFGIVGVGTTRPKSAVDFSDAGQDVTGSFEKRMFMLPPKITTAQRNTLEGVTNGAMIFNTSGNQLQVYIGGWVGIGTTAKVDS